MPETLETEAPIGVERDAGRAREARAIGPARVPVSASPALLSPDDLRLIGRTLNGEHWQADLAGLVGCSKSQITRYLNGQRTMDALLARHIQYVIVERIQQLSSLLTVPGLPYAGSQTAQDAIAAIQSAMDTVPGQEPPRAR